MDKDAIPQWLYDMADRFRIRCRLNICTDELVSEIVLKLYERASCRENFSGNPLDRSNIFVAQCICRDYVRRPANRRDRRAVVDPAIIAETLADTADCPEKALRFKERVNKLNMLMKRQTPSDFVISREKIARCTSERDLAHRLDKAPSTVHRRWRRLRTIYMAAVSDI
jgi:hypothetical protein